MSYADEKYREIVTASLAKIVTDLHDISLSLRAMSGRNIVGTPPTKEKTYAEKYFERSEIRDDCKP